MDRNEYWMKVALREAEKAFQADEVPIGAVIVTNTGEILGKGYNQRECLKDPTAHAEILAITAAANTRGDWRLDDTILYVTLEPCPMCAGAIMNARIPTVVYGAPDKAAGGCGSKFDICGGSLMNHTVTVISGVLEDQCQSLLAEFFRTIRERRTYLA
ncbi:MAG: tRNA adenosine(34) deaminase TadA [Calditrichota bacterium]